FYLFFFVWKQLNISKGIIHCQKRACVIGINYQQISGFDFRIFYHSYKNICLRLRFKITHFGFNLKNL
ncbi:unnamed protein product, partial [Brassica rapa subsp. narinosa]